MKQLYKYWFFVIFWMAVISIMSTQVGGPNHTSRFLVPFLHWLDPHISPVTVDHIHLIVRKMGHVTEFAVFALLLRWALVQSSTRWPLSWSWSVAAIVLVAAAAYGSLDELHQLFVPTRMASIRDVWIDSAGAAVGLAIAWATGQFSRKTVPARVAVSRVA